MILVEGAGTTRATLRVIFDDDSEEEQPIFGLGDFDAPVPVSLPELEDVRALEIVDIDDSYGLGLDDVEADAAI